MVATSVLTHLETPMVNWDELFARMNRLEALALINDLEAIGERSLRLARYLDVRTNGFPGTHTDAVTAQNRIGGAVRKALGFSYPSNASVNF